MDPTPPPGGSGDARAGQPEYPVFVKQGDAQPEVDAELALLGGAVTAGLHKMIYVERAAQTVVMVTHREAPLANALRARNWTEPREDG